MVDRDAVWAVLGTVIHPTFGLSLVTLEMVKAVRVDGDAVTVELRLDCPGVEAALAQVSRKLRALNPTPEPVTVCLAPEKWSPPWEGYWFTSGIA